jgi:N,N-dimethylformamidase
MRVELIGYADEISVAPGRTIGFKVSTDLARYEASIVRLIHGDANGPGFKEEVIAPIAEHQGRKQHAFAGSYGRIEHHAALPAAGFTLQAWIYPTTPAKGAQGIVAKWSGTSGYAMIIGETGEMELWLGDENTVQRLASGVPLRAHQWYFVAGTFDPQTGSARILQMPLSNYPGDLPVEVTSKLPEGFVPASTTTPLTLAALKLEPGDGRRLRAASLYNGKIGQPCMFGRPLSAEELQSLRQGTSPLAIAGLTAFWDLAREMQSPDLIDVGPHGLNGKAVNMPMRAVTGHDWTGEEIDFKHAPDEYGAVHFHDDDIEDAGWETDFVWEVPADARSGFYAARLRSGEHEDHIPFFVRPRRGTRNARTLFLVPTFTYLAYANETHKAMARHQAVYKKREMVKDPLDLYLDEHREFGISLYDVHTDGSGGCYSSRLRPIPSLRPKYRQWQFGCPRHLAADLYIVDWLEHEGIPYDVVTDHDLEAEGLSLLEGYQVVLTGTHPEYWSSRARDAMAAYLAGGGRQMYLGGNGYYWVASTDRGRPHVLEVRKGIAGTRAWNSAPGELYHSSTGELGGLWRHRGKPPNQIVGIGFKAMGYDFPTPGYRRQQGSFDERVAFIFEGVGSDEVIGEFGLALGGAAGDELDCLDYSLGSPPNTILLATASGHSPYYVPVVEDHNEMSDIVIVEQRSLVRADMVYFETANGGAVFSTGSITWCGSLSHNGYQNNVAKVTGNVLKRFLHEPDI